MDGDEVVQSVVITTFRSGLIVTRLSRCSIGDDGLGVTDSDTAYHFLPAWQSAHVPPDDAAAVEERELSELARLKAKYGG